MNISNIRLEQDHAAASAEVIGALVQWNERQVGPRNPYNFTLSVRSDDDQLLGGLVGEIYWMHLYVAVLWVHDQYRRHGLGRQLLTNAEDIARSRSCTVAYLNTASFQAPRFYEKCGYTEFGVLPWAREPYVRHWFAKRLDANPSA